MENYTKRLTIRILLLLFICLFAFHFSPLYIDTFFKILQFLTVKISYLFLLPLKPTISNATTFIIKNQLIEIADACIAYSAYILLSILILTTKDMRSKKLIKFFTYGFLALFIINIIRIDLLIYMLILMGSRLFETVHLFFWKVLSSVVVVIIWIYLTRKYHVVEIPVYSDVKYLIRKIKMKRSNK